MKKQTLPWETWQSVARKCYSLLGWPRGEMRQYYAAKMSPLEAVEAATKRRKNPFHNEKQ